MVEIPIDSTTRRLSSLDREHDVGQFAREHPQRVEAGVQAFGVLIDTFNNISVDDPVMEIMPKAAGLKKLLGGLKLPTIEEMRSSREWTVRFKHGLEEASEAMLKGQKDKGRKDPLFSNEEKIGSASMDTRSEALLVGVIGHLIERTIFQGVDIEGHEWKKDEILHPLDDGAFFYKKPKEWKILYSGSLPHPQK